MAGPLPRTKLIRGILLGVATLTVVAAVATATIRGSEAERATTSAPAGHDPAARDPLALPVAPVAEPVPVPTTTSTTAAAPPPAPVTPMPTPAPPRPVAPTPPPAPPMYPAQLVQAAFEASVPAAWRNAITVLLELIGGATSWGSPDGTIQISAAHATGSEALLRSTVAHEFGHLIAFRYGSQAFNGAGPVGWPAYGDNPAEAWADCVSQVFTGIVDPSHGLPPCSGQSLAWTADWLARGPAAHPVTG